MELPKSFLAVNVSEKHEQEAERRASLLQSEQAKNGHEDDQQSMSNGVASTDSSTALVDSGETVPVPVLGSAVTTDLEAKDP